MTTNQVFVVRARSHADGTPIQFLIEADTHRAAWKTARTVCKTGRGAFIRDLNDNSLCELPLGAGTSTVERVLASTPHKRGRPPKITAGDLIGAVKDSGRSVSRRVHQIFEDLQAA